ncbi:hypothetical protein BC830DRAFT_1125914 [Chytriomyces sp. MP71]|nr:hypothetical protein BC830DRAFT_1125914 [Chytriomyces sp. MP71]
MVQVHTLLSTIGVALDSLADKESLEEEYAVIKRAYFKKILTCHPDKGGDPSTFRAVNSAFESIRSAFETRSVASFASASANVPSTSTYDFGEKGDDFRPFDFYAAAADEPVPNYRVELAKSGRSKCQQRGKEARKCAPDAVIPKGEVRVGRINLESGGYGRWCHLACWRVPAAIWCGLPDPDTCKDASKFSRALAALNEVSFCGFELLGDIEKAAVVAHVMDKGNHAKLKGRRQTFPPTEGVKLERGATGTEEFSSSAAAAEPDMAGNTSSASWNSQAVVSSANRSRNSGNQIASAKKGKFVMPRPGINGAIADCLQGKTVVLTGIFPEVGGGVGLTLGKNRMKQICESFGARVTGSVSGRTDFLIVGQDPGFSKVNQARESERCKLLTLKDLLLTIHGQKDVKQIEDPEINSYSTGFRGNGLSLLLENGSNIARPKSLKEKGEPEEPLKEKNGTSRKTSKKRAAGKSKRGAMTGEAVSGNEGGEGVKVLPNAKKSKKVVHQEDADGVDSHPQKKARKCGICHQEGHTARICPQKV